MNNAKENARSRVRDVKEKEKKKKQKTWTNAIFRIYRPLPYSSRDGENMLSSCTPPVEITLTPYFLMFQNQGFIPQNLRFELRAHGYEARDRARTRAVEVMDVMDVIHFV
jgi:hypothetical protein